MICPKCGFEQPDSPDCMRCGIVIARFKGAAAGGTVALPPLPQPLGGSAPPSLGKPAPPPFGGPPPPPQPERRSETFYSPPAGPGAGAVPPPLPGREERLPSRETMFDPTAPVQLKTARKILLRPLHSSDLVQEAFSIFGRNAFAFTVLVGLALSPYLLVQAYYSAQKIESLSDALSAAGVILLTLILCQPLATAAVTFGVFKQMRGEDATLGACIGAGLSSLVRVLLVGIIQGLVMMAGFLFFVVPFLIMIASYSVTVPAAIEEQLGPFGALGRSSKLTEGYRWPIWRTLLSIGAANWVLTRGSALLMGALSLPQGEELAASLVSVVTTGLSATASAVIYYRLRSAQESIDVDQIASVFS